MSGDVLVPHASWSGHTVGVLGLGRSGRGAVALLTRHGARALALDDRPTADLPGDVVAELAEWGVELRAASGDVRGTVSSLDALVVSPGVAADHPLVRAAERAGRLVIGELELAARRAQAPILAVTGTNGKSTTVSLVHAILLADGRESRLVGNIGTAVSDHVEDVATDAFLVVECSSFQLERIECFAPRAAAVLNLAPDHLDRYPSFEAYGQAKRNILHAATTDTSFVFPVDDPLLAGWADETHARAAGFGPDRHDGSAAWIEDGTIVRRGAAGAESVMAVDAIPMVGGHNVRNVLAAIAMVDGLDVKTASIVDAVESFEGLAHRAVTVPSADGRRWIDDSKATNVHAAAATLEGLTGPVVALFGGRGKGEDYAPLARFADRVRVALCFGEEGPCIAEALAGALTCETHASMRDALAAAEAKAASGDTILLSPACASFDEFGGFAERGEVFARWVTERQGGPR